jgi:hypothetical protein
MPSDASGATTMAGTYLAELLRAALVWEAMTGNPPPPSAPPPPGLDLTAVLDACADHRVSSCLAPALEVLDVPAELADGIRAQHSRAVRASLPVQAATAQLSATAADAGIRCLAYKGVVLAQQTTGDPASRGFGDVDLLVDVADMPRLHRLLTDEGAYLAPGWTPAPGSDLWPWAARVRPEAPYVWRGVDIDVHWRLDRLPQAMSTPFADLWSRRAHATIGGASIPTLGAVDALLVTCVHGTKEHWRQWRWVVDAVRQIRSLSPEEWASVRPAARAAGAEVSLAIGLAVADLLTPIATPLIPGPWARARAQEAWTEGLSGVSPFGRITAAKQFQRLAWTIRTRPDDRALLSLAAQLAWSTQDMADVPLPPALLPAYPLIRPVLWRRRLARA